MKNYKKPAGMHSNSLCVVFLMCIALAACGNGSTDKESTDTNLIGTVSISGDAVVGQTLLADTSSLGGSGSIFYQWKQGDSADTVDADIGNDANAYTLAAADEGKYITVTVSREGYTGTVTSAAIGPVTVNALLNLSGNVTISPAGPVVSGTLLIAYYSGTEAVSFQWNRNDSAISGAIGVTYTPTQAGSYTVTASAMGYSSKTSAFVTVIELPPEQYITVEFNGFGDEIIDLSKSAEHNLSQSKSQWITVSADDRYDSYQWFVDGQGQWETDSSIYLHSSLFPVGIHAVAVVVTLNGIPYSKELTFRVVL